MKALVVLVTLGLPVNALAHGGANDVLSGSTWTYDPWIVTPLYLSGILYLTGTVRLWRHAGPGRGIGYWQAACFWCAWLALAFALVSPLHWLGERLFTAHMLEHGVLMIVAAPLLALARPMGAIAWGLPARLRPAFGSLTRRISRSRPWLFLIDPLIAALLHGFAVWAWHMPILYNAVIESVTVHRLQHLSFFLTALLFWWSLLQARPRQRSYGIAIFVLFATMLHTGVLGILLTLSRQLWYPQQVAFAAEWGLTPLEDQQLAGLVMWVPMGLIYTAAALAIAARWISDSSHWSVVTSAELLRSRHRA
jgi:cytochrome c oxidase assembly factor CtaG